MPITSRFGSMSSQGFGQFIYKSITASSARIEYVAVFSGVALLSPLSIPSLSIGSASTSRIVVFTAMTRTGTGRSLVLSSDGVALSRVIGSTGFSSVFLFQRKITTGSAISLTLTAVGTATTLSICSVSAHALYDLATETSSFTSTTVGTSTISITIPAQNKSVHICGGMNNGTTAGASINIGGLTRNYLIKSTNNGTWATAGGSGSSPTAESLVVTQTPNVAGVIFRLTVASWA